MKNLLISDVHGDYNALKDVYNQNLNCDYYFLLGDSMLPKYLTSDFLTVKGNCDFEDYKESYDLVIDGKIMTDNLKAIGKDYNWLKKQVEKFGINPEQALIVTYNGSEQMFCQKKGGA